jgi:predicted nucleic acid-binding protein
MSVLVDSGVIYAQTDRDASRNGTATTALRTILEGEYGQPYVTDYIYDETVTLTLARTGDHDEATRVGRRLRGAASFPELLRITHITESVFERAVDVFEKFDDQGLSFTDATSVAFIRTNDIDTLLSFDDDFDGLVDRTAPEKLGPEHNP